MKNKFIIVIILLAVFSSSCKKDFLDRQPLDQYSETSLWTSANDANAALNGCYSGFEDGTWIFYMATASDDAFSAFPGEGHNEYGNMVLLTPTNTPNNKWNFNTIQKCNWFLASIDKTPMDDSLKTRMKAEARFLRAYKYFIMSQLYGDVPLVTTNLSTEESDTVTRTPKAQVVQFILDELGAIALQLPASYTGTDVGRVTSGAAWALKARVELYNQRYQDCITTSANIMGKYSLFPNYTDLFRIQNEHNSEIIFDIEYIENDVPLTSLGRNALHFQGGGGGGWYAIDPTQSLVDNYEMTNGKTIDDPSSGYDPNNPYVNRDPRLAATVIVPGDLVDGTTYFNPLQPGTLDYWLRHNFTGFGSRKYTSHLTDFDDMWNCGLNIPLIRYAEVLLNYAEAKIEANQIDNTVYDAINQVRNRVGMPNVDQSVYNSQTTLRTLVRRERRSELGMEGLRWFDIQRWKIADQVMSGPVYGSRLGTVDPNNGHVVYSSDRILSDTRTFDPSKNYLWPVPQSEIDINKNLKQNPGY